MSEETEKKLAEVIEKLSKSVDDLSKQVATLNVKIEGFTQFLGRAKYSGRP